MSVIKFKLTEEHIKLIKEINWYKIAFPHIEHEVNPNTPFTDGDSILDDIALILYGRNPDYEILPDSETHRPQLTEEEVAHVRKLYEELPMALDVICQTGKFECGDYKTKYSIRFWKKIESANKLE